MNTCTSEETVQLLDAVAMAAGPATNPAFHHISPGNPPAKIHSSETHFAVLIETRSEDWLIAIDRTYGEVAGWLRLPKDE